MTADAFYALKPFLPRWLQIKARQQIVRWRARRNQCRWPIFKTAEAPPAAWPGWPGGKRFALVLSHDVESATGVARCEQLADLEQQREVRSAFGFVPLRYHTPERIRRALLQREFEIMVHDLYHDGKLYRSRAMFEQRRERINGFLKQWGTRGFSSGSMHHNLPWIGELEIDFDLSTYDVDPFEPQACGLGRIFPFWVQLPRADRTGFVEMPYTLPQDFTLFALLRERNIAIWRRKLDWIASHGGMALMKTHPDYMLFPGSRARIDGYPVRLYAELLDYVKDRYGDEVWFAQPSEVARFWRGLHPPDAHNGAVIATRETFCPTCRQAHANGWLRDFPPLPAITTA